jgi:hypothetical protein
MPYWLNSLLFAILIVTIPFTMILRILTQLPKPIALANKKWPAALNLVLIGLITAYVTIFIRSTYYVRGGSAITNLLQFVIASLAYGLGLVLILRQFTGLYPEFLVTTGTAGLGIRRLAYRNVTDIEEVWRSSSETRLRIQTIHDTQFLITLPTHQVSVLHERLKASQPPE